MGPHVPRDEQTALRGSGMSGQGAQDITDMRVGRATFRGPASARREKRRNRRHFVGGAPAVRYCPGPLFLENHRMRSLRTLWILVALASWPALAAAQAPPPPAPQAVKATKSSAQKAPGFQVQLDGVF